MLEYVGSVIVPQISEGKGDTSGGVISVSEWPYAMCSTHTFDTSQVPRAFTAFMRSYFFTEVSWVVVGEIADAGSNSGQVDH